MDVIFNLLLCFLQFRGLQIESQERQNPHFGLIHVRKCIMRHSNRLIHKPGQNIYIFVPPFPQVAGSTIRMPSGPASTPKSLTREHLMTSTLCPAAGLPKSCGRLAKILRSVCQSPTADLFYRPRPAERILRPSHLCPAAFGKRTGHRFLRCVTCDM